MQTPVQMFGRAVEVAAALLFVGLMFSVATAS